MSAPPLPSAGAAPDRTSGTAEHPRPARTLAVVCAGTLAVLVHFTMVLLGARTTAAALHSGPGAQVWLVAGISLGLAAALLPAGVLADRRGHRRVFAGGAALLAAATVLCAAAPDAVVFTAGRIVQGIAGAAVLAAGLGIVAETHPGPARRARATGLWGAALGAGILLGPLLTAALAAPFGWRAPYWAAAAGTAAIAGTAALLPSDPGPGPGSRAYGPGARPARPDVPGAVLLIAALLGIVGGCAQGRTGWTQPLTLGLLAAGLALAAGFLAVEARRRAPMLDPALLRRGPFAAAAAGAFTTGVSITSLIAYLPNPLQAALHQGPLAAAAEIGVWSGLSVATAAVAPRLLRAVPTRTQVIAALAGVAAGQALLAAAPALGAGWTALLPGLVVSGLAVGVSNGAVGRLALESAPPGRGAMASGVNNTARYTGSSLGIAVLTAVAAAAGFPAAAATSAAFTLAGTAAVALLAPRRG